MTTVPIAQINDAHKLSADAEIELFALSPSIGEGTIYFKADNTVTWQGHEYTGVPLAWTGEKRSAQTGAAQPRLTLGDTKVDLSLFKPLLFDGVIDGGTLVKTTVLLDDLVNNRAIMTQRFYRVRRPSNYSRSQIQLELASLSDAVSFTLPYRQYLPPAFPAVSR